MFANKHSLCVILCYMIVGCSLHVSDWDSYIDVLLQQSKDSAGQSHLDKACIISLLSGVSYTSSSHPNSLVLKDGEGMEIAKCFLDKNFAACLENGIAIGGVTYTLISTEDKIAYGRQKTEGNVIMRSTKQLVLIGHGETSAIKENIGKAVNNVALYLESLGM